MTMTEVDVLIAGAGPAGCAAAISLAQFAPDLRVCLVDRADAHAPHIGETVPPAIKPMLDHLGLWSRFGADRHSPSHRTLSAWGTAELVSNEFLFHTQQVGWRIDRARFDAMLLEVAAARVHRLVRDMVVGLGAADGGWHAMLRRGPAITARFAIDATGRGAALYRALGQRPMRLDRLVGCVVPFVDADDDGEGLMIEAVPDGWWYTAAVPGCRRVVAYMSDGDLVRAHGVGRADRWMEALRATRHVRAAVASARPAGPPRVLPAGSSHVAIDASRPLIAVGDAASCFDPVSGQGILKALRSGIFSSYAVADALRGDPAGIARYRALMRREFAAYRQTLTDFHALELRWTEQPFWKRRQHPPAGPATSRSAVGNDTARGRSDRAERPSI
jgi:2-polyprenyl-6-methoxyphenol hydroxylase-like FAD-dependent oxidoreductase